VQSHPVLGPQRQLLVCEAQARRGDVVRPHREVDEVLLQQQEQTPRDEEQYQDPEDRSHRRLPAHGRIMTRRLTWIIREAA